MFGGVFRFVVELHLGVQACAIAGWALFSCESIGPSPKHEFTDRKPDTPQPFLSSAPDEIQTAERSAWTHMVQKNSHTVRFMSTFFFTCQRQAQPLRLSNMCCSYSVCLKSSCLPFFCKLRFSCNKRTVNVFPASFLCSHVLISTFSTFYQLCVCVRRTEKSQ